MKEYKLDRWGDVASADQDAAHAEALDKRETRTMYTYDAETGRYMKAQPGQALLTAPARPFKAGDPGVPRIVTTWSELRKQYEQDSLKQLEERLAMAGL